MQNSNKYGFLLFLRAFILLVFLLGLAFAIAFSKIYLALAAGILAAISFYKLNRFITARFKAMDDFFESVKYRDFSRWYVEKNSSMQNLHKGFNEVNRMVKEINAEKETQYLYLQKILEMINIGIIAYNLKTGRVLWANEAFKKTLDLPSFKNIGFVEKRKPELYEKVVEPYHIEENSVELFIKHEKINLLVSNTVFLLEDESYKLIVLHNIEATLNRNESEAWKKLLSVMTHEIMNSIAPISSLADTLQTQVQHASSESPMDREDLYAGLSSIQKRSEGLMKFAKTYRSLNKVTRLNPEKIKVNELFGNIRHLMQTSLKNKNIPVDLVLENPNLEIEIDVYLIEQVLINLLLNAIDACAQTENPNIILSGKTDMEGHGIIQIRDNGKGVPTEILDRIFVPFFTTKETGSGIGLSLCKQIMLLHKGKIQLNSKEGTGTVVRLVF